jgi:hypothetical protein
VAELDRLAAGSAATAQLLNRAGVAAGVAQDLVTAIVVDAAGWVAAELAATAVADLVTLGLATAGGALVGSATLAAFVVRAERVSAEFGTLLEQLVTELAELRAARDAIVVARGLSTLRALRQAHDTIAGLHGAGSGLHAAERVADVALGQATGLPLDGDGPMSLGSQLRRSISEEAEQIESGSWDTSTT